MANRKRNILMKFWVTPKEKELIDEKMKQPPTQRYGAYLRKMAIDGYIIYTLWASITQSKPLPPGLPERPVHPDSQRLSIKR